MNIKTTIKKSLSILAVGLIMAACNSEMPFETEGIGKIRMNISMNSKITRADITEEEQNKLAEECVVYISDKDGLLHKWKGLDNLPEELALKYGNYKAEAWSGDSVTASFDKKFYQGETDFEVSAEKVSQTVAINCRISNVIGSVNMESIKEYVKELSVTFSNSRGSLTMKGDTLYMKSYFMMPNKDTQLKYHVVGTTKDGVSVNKEGIIEDVIKGHEYRLNFISDPSESTTGGALFDIVVKEYDEEKEDDITIYGKPSFSWANSSISVGGQIVHIDEDFNSEMLRVAAYNGGFSSLLLETGNMSSSFNNNSQFELLNLEGQYLENMKSYGITIDKGNGANKDGMYVWHITFSADLFNNLPKSDEEYVMTLTAKDGMNKTNSILIRVANSSKAVKYEDPIIIETSTFNNNKLAVNASSATIPVTIVDGTKYLALQYRVKDSSSWQTVDVVKTRANQTVNVELKNLQAGSTYEYRVVAGDYSDDKYEFESSIQTFKTEEKFIIPNSSMENWYKNNKVWEPNSEANFHEFWDTGNHGSTTLGEDYNITTRNSDLKHNGTYSACLKSQFVGLFTFGKFAAGNLFVGEFGETVGTDGAKLTFGRPYNGSHPKFLRLYANYRPGTVDYSSINDLPKGQNDHGQVYVAIASGACDIDTSIGKMFDKNASNILGYGEVIWADNFGKDNELEAYDIPITYNSKAQTTTATHIIIVCSASQYGDYFTGSSTSILYLDDFELVY